MCRLKITTALVLLAATIPLASCYQGSGADEYNDDGKIIGVSAGDKPKIDYQSFDGRHITNETLRGKVVLLDFWASWCGPCLAEAPHMVKLYKDYGSRGVQFVGLDFDDNVEQMKQAIAKHGLVWPQVTDGQGPEGPLAQSWRLEGIPQVVILSPQGVVFWAGHPAEVDRHLEAAVKQWPAAAGR